MVNHQKNIRTTGQLWEALESTWASIPVERFQHLVVSMPQRIEAVLRAWGAEGVPNVWYPRKSPLPRKQLIGNPNKYYY